MHISTTAPTISIDVNQNLIAPVTHLITHEKVHKTQTAVQESLFHHVLDFWTSGLLTPQSLYDGPTDIISTPPPPSLPCLRSKCLYHSLPNPLSLPHRFPKYRRPCPAPPRHRYRNLSDQPALRVSAYSFHHHPCHRNPVRGPSRLLLSGPMHRTPAQRNIPKPLRQLQCEFRRADGTFAALTGRGCREVVLLGL